MLHVFKVYWGQAASGLAVASVATSSLTAYSGSQSASQAGWHKL